MSGKLAIVTIAAASGTVFLAALAALASGVPGPGPVSPAAAALAPFARAGYLFGLPLVVVALLVSVLTRILARDASLIPRGVRWWAIGLLLTFAVAVAFSAMFTLYNALDLRGLAEGPDPGVLRALGTLGRAVMPYIPASLLHVGVAALGVAFVGLGPSVRRDGGGLGRSAQLVAALGLGAGFLWWSTDTAAMGGALQAGQRQRMWLLVLMAVAAGSLVALLMSARRRSGQQR